MTARREAVLRRPTGRKGTISCIVVRFLKCPFILGIPAALPLIVSSSKVEDTTLSFLLQDIFSSIDR